jgi:hypothetical protein
MFSLAVPADLEGQNMPEKEDAIAHAIEQAEELTDAIDPPLKKPNGHPIGDEAGRIARTKSLNPKNNQSEMLVSLVNDANLFHTPEGMTFADVLVGDHRETLEIGSEEFSQLMTFRYFKATDRVPSPEPLKSATRLLEARARYQGNQHEVHVRVAKHAGNVYLDLADETWRCVEIGPQGWKVVSGSPIRFRRPKGMKPLPAPQAGGSVYGLRRFVNVASEDHFVLLVCWSVAAIIPSASYSILVLQGEQGSAKSTAATFLRSLIDPNIAPLRSVPRKEEDLHIAAMNSHVLGFDNVSKLPDWLSDALCRLATGAGQGTRQFYTNKGEVLFSAARPIIANGIEHFIEREDLAERSLVIPQLPIPEQQRRTTEDLNKEFNEARPRLLGSLLDLVSHALRSEITTDWLPRMADFGRNSIACETAIWPQGTFREAFMKNQDEAVENAIEADQIAATLRRMLLQTMQTMQTHNSQDRRASLAGTATTLLGLLNQFREESGERADGNWPKTGHALSNRLRRAEPFLRRAGIEICRTKEGHGHDRIIRIVMSIPEITKSPSAPSASSASDAPQTCEEADDVEVKEAVAKLQSGFDPKASAHPHSPAVSPSDQPQATRSVIAPGLKVVIAPDGRRIVVCPLQAESRDKT